MSDNDLFIELDDTGNSPVQNQTSLMASENTSGITEVPKNNSISNNTQINNHVDNNLSNELSTKSDEFVGQKSVETVTNTINIQNNVDPTNATSIVENNVSQKNLDQLLKPDLNNTDMYDEELLKIFIGNNYEKITKNGFNFAGFFFTTFYMFYRKMFLYGVLLYTLNLIISLIINNFIINLLFGGLVGLFVNKIYLYYARKKIAMIKFNNQEKNIGELKLICSSKGGTSVGTLILGFITEFGIVLISLVIMSIAGIGGFIGDLFNPHEGNTTINGQVIKNDSTNNSETAGKEILLEDARLGGYACSGSNCNISIIESNNLIEYAFKANNVDLFNVLRDYSDYIKVNIYYTQNNKSRIITDYKIYLRSTNEDISNVRDENELRSKLGLYTVGMHSAVFTLSKIGMTGSGFNDDGTIYTYIRFTFLDDQNNEYEMKYKNFLGASNLIEGGKYTVSFEVVEGTFDYEYLVKDIK